MIELYEGRLGGGKTYSATVRIVDHVRRGGLIATNIDLVWDEVKRYISDRFGLVAQDDQYLPLSDEHIGLFHRFTPSGTAELPVLVVIDEAHLTFNARDYAKTDKLYRETLTFLTQSRKVHTDVIFIAQSILNMDKQFMRLVQYIWRFRDLSKWKIPGLGLRYPFKQILAVQFDYDGHTILQRSFVNRDTRIFRLFRTNALLREFPRLEGQTTLRKLEKTQETKSMAKVLIPLGIIVGIIAAFFLWHKMSNIGKAPEPKTSIKSPAIPASPFQRLTEEKKKNEGQYDIYSETFQAWNGPEKSLSTIEGGWYQLGEMSSRGYVIAVSDRRAKIAQPDGRTGWIVAMRTKLASEQLTEETASPAPSGKVTEVPDSGPFYANPSPRPQWSEHKETNIVPNVIPTVTPIITKNGRQLHPNGGLIPITPNVTPIQH